RSQADPGHAGRRSDDAWARLAAQLRARPDLGADFFGRAFAASAFRLSAAQPQFGGARALHLGPGKMMRRRLSATVAAAGRGGSAAGGCFPRGPAPWIFSVRARAGAAANAAMPPAGLPASSSPTIGLGPIKLPEHLDRDEMVTRMGPNRLELSDKDRWAEP